MESAALVAIVEDQRVNAVLAWAFTLFLVAAAAAAAWRGHLLWAGFAGTVAVLGLLPAVAYGGPQVMLPWEVLALAAAPVVGRTFVVGQVVGGITLTGRVTTHLAVAAVALIVAVELDLFTPVRMTRSFAVAFVAVATTATAGVWAVAQWASDLHLGTTFLLDGRPEAVVERAVMLDFVAATVVGLLAGLLFEWYFRRRAHADDRLPVDVRAQLREEAKREVARQDADRDEVARP